MRHERSLAAIEGRFVQANHNGAGDDVQNQGQRGIF
jgi:hypothetical protein